MKEIESSKSSSSTESNENSSSLTEETNVVKDKSSVEIENIGKEEIEIDKKTENDISTPNAKVEEEKSEPNNVDGEQNIPKAENSTPEKRHRKKLST